MIVNTNEIFNDLCKVNPVNNISQYKYHQKQNQIQHNNKTNKDTDLSFDNILHNIERE